MAMKDTLGSLAAQAKALPQDQRTPLVILGVLSLAIVASYWSMLGMAADSWSQPQYSHGYLVPLFAIVLLFLRREPFAAITPRER
jgi:hypothetical protein